MREYVEIHRVEEPTGKKIFGETFAYSENSEEEKKVARNYLELWKGNLLRKLSRDSFHCEVIDEQWGDRPSLYDSSFDPKSIMYLKLCLEANWEYEL